MDKIDH